MKTAKVETAEGKATQLDASSSSQKTGGKKQKQTAMSNKAGLVFPINRVRKSLQKGNNYGKKVGKVAGVYMSAVLEYISAEVIELAGNASRDLKTKRITPRHLYLAIRGDEELDFLAKDATLSGGGVIPHIHRALLGKEDQNKQKNRAIGPKAKSNVLMMMAGGQSSSSAYPAV